ncbi:uncharacterized protein BP01DRAFT_360831 [Aspergillus saccharolyticus JOP 1030-1]|uniref:Uncharacterized protein n=1 Tax=Aspergillus saccharolyticus JOP 1030-1 TaxID=1450539 RepID=A0A318Z3R8_9EURO|nr:hypothetical protein BP01DRAFT_360831 [Aspergillus saccharolyticus JOP 1030-1]PYH40957.1 hypothetical protein BP01DRAFT_360831 [Aspergillus saccharolyticus JOP 1030-1]
MRELLQTSTTIPAPSEYLKHVSLSYLTFALRPVPVLQQQQQQQGKRWGRPRQSELKSGSLWNVHNVIP